MTPNQRDAFMYSWQQRRKRGRMGNALLSAGIGAAGGLLFGLMLIGDIADPGGNAVRLFGMAIPTFAMLALGLGDRVYRSNEAMYQNFVSQGATAPAHKPTLTTAERGPQIAVLVAVVIIGGFIAVVAMMYG